MSLKKQIGKSEDKIEDFDKLPLEIKQLDNSGQGNEILMLENQVEIMKTLLKIQDDLSKVKKEYYSGWPR
jgi:hypothetical protein